MEKRSKNSLSLMLTESAVFLRTLPGRQCVENSQPSMLRGLLVLDLVKPTRISSIELELRAKTTTIWPEGFGARRIEITEENTVFQTSVVYFRAGRDPLRRPTSVGPGIIHDNLEDWDEQHHPHISPSTARPSTRPSIRRISVDDLVNYSAGQYDQHTDVPIPPYSSTPLSPESSLFPPSPGGSAAPSSNGLYTPSGSQDRRRSTSAFPFPSSPAPSTQGHQNGNSLDNPLQREGSTSPFPMRATTPMRIHDSSRERRAESRFSRFSLTSMSNAFMDVVRLRHDAQENQESRGRTLEKGASLSQPRGRALDAGTVSGPAGSKERSTLDIISDLLRPEEPKDHGLNWQEFKKGTYTYPISIAIPGHCPPTLRCEFGHVVWHLDGVVHRPGAFNPKLTTTREVIVIACPIDDDTEGSENIIVERHWDNQLQYLISISGRSFYIGGTMPISFTFMPLAKVRLHKIVVCIEERVDYYTKMKRLARSDPMNRIVLLSVKGAAKGEGPILPLESDDVDAFRESPLYALVTPDDDLSEVASSLMGPGPWTFHQELPLPSSCSEMHFTNKNKWSNIAINHTLKWTIRVESASSLHVDPKTGKRKMFDIVVQTPVHVLSCRCDPEWSALPGYSERLSDPRAVLSGCPCRLRGTKRTLCHSSRDRESSELSDSSASSAESNPINFQAMRSLRQDLATLLEVTSQYERLVSGQETEMGDMPPAYDECHIIRP